MPPTSFKTAQLLKEAGFNLKVTHFYTDGQHVHRNNVDPKDWNQNKSFTSAPTHEDVMKWMNIKLSKDWVENEEAIQQEIICKLQHNE